MANYVFDFVSKKLGSYTWHDRHNSPLFNTPKKLSANNYGGGGFIGGILPGVVSVDGSPASRQIECRTRSNRKLVATTYSSAVDGTYMFDQLSLNHEFDLIARDHGRVYSDVIIPAVRPWAYEFTSSPDQKTLPQYIPNSTFKYEFYISGSETPYSLNVISSPSNVTTTLEGNMLTIEGGEGIEDSHYSVQVSDSSNSIEFSMLSFDLMTPVKYWRVNITSANTYTALAELEMATVAEGVTECVGGEPISNGDYSGAPVRHGKANAFDGDYDDSETTSWASSSSSSGWIGYIFPEPKLITEVRIVARVSLSQYPIDFTVEKSVDGINWGVVASYTGLTTGWVLGTPRVFSLVE